MSEEDETTPPPVPTAIIANQDQDPLSQITHDPIFNNEGTPQSTFKMKSFTGSSGSLNGTINICTGCN